MPRIRRRHAPGAVVHVIIRFVDGQFIMDEVEGARSKYLERLDRALHRSDWTLCWYALMGTHVHLGLVCGETPLDRWARSLHSGWANWVNRAGRRRGGRSRGPVLADRPKTLLIRESRIPKLGAYVHNNPVRAGVVETPEDSSWTSHRAYLGLQMPLASLDIAKGLSFYGCTPSAEGRSRFHEYVMERRRDPRDPELSDATMRPARTRSRALHGSAAELATPVLGEGAAASYPVVLPAASVRTVAFDGTATEFLARFASALGIDVEQLRGPGRNRRRARLREVAVVAWHLLGRRASEMSGALCVSQPAISNMLARVTEAQVNCAEQVLRTLAVPGGRLGRPLVK